MNQYSDLKILHIASGDLWAGAETQLYTLAKTQHTQPGVIVNVVLLNHGPLEEKLVKSGIQVLVLDESKLNGLKILHQLVRIIRELHPDVIHTHRVKENIIGSMAGLLANRTPSVRTVHGAPEHHPPWWKIPKHLINTVDWFCGRVLQRLIIAVSDDLATLLKKDYPSCRIKVVENGIDIDTVCRDEDEHPATQTDREAIRIGLAGRLAPVKRVDIFVETAKYIHDHHPDLPASFHIFGDGPHLEKLKHLSRKLETDKYVHFEGHSDNLQCELMEMDILLMTSDHEGLPMILLEAMALKIPIIAHAVGGIPVLLDSGSCGVLVDSHNASGYGEAIYELARNPEMRLDLITRALIRVKTRYSAGRNAREYLANYLSILSRDGVS